MNARLTYTTEVSKGPDREHLGAARLNGKRSLLYSFKVDDSYRVPFFLLSFVTEMIYMAPTYKTRLAMKSGPACQEGTHH